MPEVWRRKHVRKVRYVASGPPRDIVGIRDMRAIDNPYQRRMIEQLQQRDAMKFVAGHEVDATPEHEGKLPEPIEIPRNQRLDYYLIRAFEAARSALHGHAYWYFMEAVAKSKSPHDMRRYTECAEANLKEWRRIYG